MRKLTLLLTAILLVTFSCKKTEIFYSDESYVYNGPLGDITKIIADKKMSAEEVAAYLPPDVSQYISIGHGVRILTIEYKSENKDGKTVRASGTIMIPDIEGSPLPIASYQHGTSIEKSAVPSIDTRGLEYLLNLGLVGSSNIISCIPDYLGLGTGEGRHLYLHPKEQANSVRDIIRATRKLVQSEKDIRLKEDIYLFGYSQGGHATMAAQRELEINYPKEFKLKASAPMAGPYALSRTKQFDMLFDSVYYPNPFYFPYILINLKASHPEYISSYSDVLISPYAERVDEVLDGYHGFGQANAQFSNYINTMIREDVKEAVKNNPDHPLRKAARTLDLTEDWTPKTPTKLYHCSGDRDVLIENAIYADSVFRAKGAPVEFVNIGNYNHTDCAPYAMVLTKMWLDSFLNK